MEYKITISGFGGQGALFLGKALALAGVIEGKEVTWLPSYGPEMRGGTANCRVIISEEQIASPAFITADALIAMNQPSVDKFAKNTTGLVIADDRYITDCKTEAEILAINTKICQEGARFGKLVNMVMLGAFLKKTGILGFESVSKVVSEIAKYGYAELDVEAMEYGMSLV